ncbi:hypothetical protein XA68_14888 [Ophiocordyceps unilateralis]|uniref:Mso1 N-terminal domain-containing protein n=1 Tax=Ophiocordyceps unilateralis TaxID=268505 RepID=A0A2A9P9E0_OPHUN|nr:hypothetical protein XA68_14888 [Ophiocordyceps unilateralis]
MASWYSSILTKTTSHISSLRATLLSSDADGEDDDDTHVCRVLRNYYTDKGRPLPSWLPPDPKAPAAAPAPAAPQQPAVGSRYGARAQQQQQQQSGGGLSSLWDSSGGAQQRSNDLAPPRPDMPNQRAGSYQASASAQDRLRQRLRASAGPGGARTASPQGPNGPFAPPAAESVASPRRVQGLPLDPRRPGGPRGYR